MEQKKNTVAALLWKTILEKYDKAQLVNIGILDNGAAFIDVNNISSSEKEFEMFETKIKEYISNGFLLSDIEIVDGKVPLVDSNVMSTVAFKIFSISGAYIDGDETKEMVTRLRIWVFDTQKELDIFLKNKDEQGEYDHRKINEKIGMYVISNVIGKGLPLYTKKGAAIKRVLERFIIDEEIKRGYTHVSTPEITSTKLYEKSGHLNFYKDSMYSPIDIDGEEYILRPMTCPHHFELFLSSPKSYKELPLRIAEVARLFRYERSGELTGLNRVRAFALSDAHIFCADDEQAKQEVFNVLDFIEHINTNIFGLNPNEDYWYRLSLGDKNNSEKYAQDGEVTPEHWENAEGVLRSVLQSRSINFIESEGEAAFYGPKIDIQMRSITGKEDTAFTVQWDFLMPKRFDLKYTGKDGKSHETIVIHRSSIGATERLIAFLIEKYKGVFPFWLSPTQVKIVTVSDSVTEYAQGFFDSLLDAGIRVEKDFSDEKFGTKIYSAKEEKLPYVVILGEKDRDANLATLESRDGTKELKTKEDLIAKLLSENISRK